MPWTPLDSSNLEAYDYDREQGILHVKFRGGRTYSYRDVPADVAEGLGTAESAGRYFAEMIRERFRPFW